MEKKAVLQQIPLEKLTIKKNVRSGYDEEKIKELAESIKKQGLLQPITVTPNMRAGYDILFGHRRYLAYKKLAENAPKKYAAIPCIVKQEVDEEEVVELQLIENLQRENISAVDLKNSLVELKNRGLTHQQIAKQIGKSLGYVKNLFSAIKTLNEDTDLEALIEEHSKITMTDIREVQGLPSREQLRLLKLRAGGVIGSVQELKDEVKKVKEKERERPEEDGRFGKREIHKTAYIKDNEVIFRPAKYTIPEMSTEEKKATASYLRNLAEKIDHSG